MSTLTVTAQCTLCNSIECIHNINNKDYKRLIKGKSAQHIWPELHAKERAVLTRSRTTNHICDNCWDKIFTVCEVRQKNNEEEYV
jgi:hypothetical protein